MGHFAVISGPEKAGKTTLIDALAKCVRVNYDPFIRHWSGPAEDQRNTRYLRPLQDDYVSVQAGFPVIWDRSWLCHNVYGLLLNSPMNETVRNPLLSEWLYGRAISHLGKRFVLLPSSLRSDPSAPWNQLASRRSADDLPVHPKMEYSLYKSLAESYGWEILENDYTDEGLERNLDTILSTLSFVPQSFRLEELVSPPHARVCFVGEKPTEDYDRTKGEWLPFTDKSGIAFANLLGSDALRCAWAYSHRLPPQHLRAFDTLVTFGELPYIWCKNYIGHKKVIALPALRHVVSKKYEGELANVFAILRPMMGTPRILESSVRKDLENARA